MFVHVTYRYTTDSNAVGILSGIMAAEPKKILQEAERACRKRQIIRMMDPSEGSAHGFPAHRLIDIAIRPATDADVSP